jgi:phosphoglycolate phosphatase
MMMNKNTVIFDLDGTLLYTLTDLTDATNYALRSMGMPERSLEEVRQFVGNGIRKLVERAVPEGTGEDALEQTFSIFKEYYDAHCTDHTMPYEGVLELMEQLQKKGYKMAIVSNKVDKAVKELNESFFSRYISVAIGEKEGVRKKPAPDTVYEALKELGSSKDEAVYVGDSDVDLATAVNSGLPCISVLWGFRDRDFLVERGATVFAREAADVLRILEEDRISK